MCASKKYKILFIILLFLCLFFEMYIKFIYVIIINAKYQV